MNGHRFTTAEDAKTFILGGSAVFTITSLKTGKHFTFKVKEKKEEGLNGPNLRFVNVLAGPDNHSFDESIPWVHPIGWQAPDCIWQGRPDALALKHWRGFLSPHNDNLPEQVKIQHEGRCCKCNRVLTHPESLDRGIGPECASTLVNINPACPHNF